MRINLLGVDIDAFDLAETVEQIVHYVRNGRLCRIITANPEILYNAQSDPALLEMVRRAELVTADGIGVVWASRMAGSPLPGRVTGIDLMLRLVERAVSEGWRIFLLGAAPGIAEVAAAKLCRDFPGLHVAGVQHGYFTQEEEKKIVKEIKAAKPELLFVALGAPRQEWWIDQYLYSTGVIAAMGVGGSFDVISGKVSRAPGWVQRLHLEWLYRLIKDPERWRRQAVLPRFAWIVIRKYKGI